MYVRGRVSLAVLLLLLGGSVGASADSIPRHDVQWDHYVVAWAERGTFFVRVKDSLHDFDIYEPALADSNGRTARSIVYGANECRRLGEVSVSPSASQIALANTERPDEGECDIYITNIEGSGSRRLTSSPGWESAPRWSSDGTAIAYENDGVVVVDLTSAASQSVARGYGARWSPDARQLAFTSGTASTLFARDGETDEVSCGPGQDRALVDFVDRVSADCEMVSRAKDA